MLRQTPAENPQADPRGSRTRTTIRPWAFWILCVAGLAAPGSALSRVVEEEARVPASVVAANGERVEREVVVTIFRDDAFAGPRPVVVLNHGRSYKSADRAAMGRARYSATSRWLAGLGFLVAVPTRIGYGATGGEDVEDSGSCSRKRYPGAYAAAAEQTLRVLDFVRRREDAAKDRSLVMGQSFGGATAIAVASLDPAGVRAAINFAGGGGGNPETRPDDPCSQEGLLRLFSGYGKSARMPTLWIYAENDRYFGPKLPREWFDAFRAAGGNGEFVLFPPHGDNGHSLFTRAPELWQPRVLDFLRSLGYELPRTAGSAAARAP